MPAIASSVLFGVGPPNPRVVRRIAADYADSGNCQGEAGFFSVGGRRAAGSAMPRAIPRTATDTPPRSAPTPRSHSSLQSRSRSPSLDRPFVALGGLDASAAATNTGSDSCPDAPGSRCGGCAPTLRLPRRLPSDIGYDRNSPPGALPIASSPLRAGDGRCYSQRPPRQSCTKPLPARGSPPEPELPPASPRCRGGLGEVA